MNKKTVFQEFDQAMKDQDDKWGVTDNPDISPEDPGIYSYYSAQAEDWKSVNNFRAMRGSIAWDGILLEEIYEALAEEDPARLREELIQAGAVIAQWIKAIDRRETNT